MATAVRTLEPPVSAAVTRGATGSATDRLRALLPRGRQLPAATWESRHRGILWLLVAHSVAIPVYGLVRGFGPVHMLLEGLVVPVTALVAASDRIDRRVRTLVASVGLMSSSAILVHLSAGLIEMHFHFFVMVAVVALYQDWLPFLTAVAYVFLHHGVMGAVDPRSVYNHADAVEHPWRWAGVHALFVTGTSIACLVTWRLNESILAHNEALYDSERLAHASSERARGDLSLLAEASATLTASLDADEVLGQVAALVVPALADVCIVDVLDADGRLVRTSCAGPDSAGRGPGMSELLASAPATDAAHVVVTCLGATSPLVAVPAPAELLPAGVAAEGTSAVVVPVVGRTGVLGALSLVSLDPGRVLGDRELRLAAELARRAGTTLENARLYARERGVAETLQHSLLPERLPDLPGIECAARYVAGGPGVEVGGDWYDVVQLSGGRLLLTMGDVVGRGEKAAALMGQLRNAARAYALLAPDPGALVAQLNRLLHDVERADMATMACVLLDPEAGTLRLASAGHPPPALRSAHGGVTWVPTASGPPLGAVPSAVYEETTSPLEPGATVVLYTDGLVEDRLMTLEVGMARLAEAVRTAPDEVEALCSQVLAAGLGARSARDDAAVLVVRLVPLTDALTLELPTQVSSLEPMRSTLRRWLARAGASPEESYEIVLAACEAAANAVVHAAPPGGARFRLRAVLDGDVRIEVEDRGGWRPPRRDHGGRGLHIMRALMDDVHVETADSGTTVQMRRRLARQVEVAS